MTAAPLRVVIAPDSLKGSCSASTAARALAQGARAALGPGVQIHELPLADGGEGTLEVLAEAWGGEIVAVPTSDALDRPRVGRIALSADGSRAVVEAAEANGLPHVADEPLRALDADSAGVGALLRAALDAGARELLVCIGGSATSDGGAGMLRALGVRLLRADGAPIAGGARGLSELARIDLSGLLPAAREARWRIAVDVTNPLLGAQGAASVFGPQKGASPAEVAVIDAGLARFAELLAEAGETSPAATRSAAQHARTALTTLPGLGAAGGLALGPVALWGAELMPGAELVAAAVGLDAALREADLVLTGEGRLDAQSLAGKVVSRVLAGCASAGSERPPRVVVIAGSVALSAAECRAAGITAALSLAPGPATLSELQRDASALLAETAAHACALAFPAGPLGAGDPAREA
ncbi:glycerate kinase [Leucobacter chromiireducens]|uniref:Glycerate kinase n=1 Tax=Leucobacter chromiireducens subsp. chromiireducens TaxID=660067 RepID=A0ABS1SKA2_9MICO|nr:glycerate kinase [Leucobacter chromiireducens]MBL3688597.1 glycerate kinase [Leucobacter chromiireducens subsp. chromiireducens]